MVGGWCIKPSKSSIVLRSLILVWEESRDKDEKGGKSESGEIG